MRVEHQIHVQIHDDSDAKDALWAPDKTLAKEVITNMQRMTSGTFQIAAAATEVLALGDITAVRAIYIEVDDDFNVVWNGGDEIFNYLLADATSGRKARCFNEMTVTACSITNPGAAAINGRYVVFGDPTA